VADLYRAYRLLNSTYGLGLTEDQIVAAEKMVKMAISNELGHGVEVDSVHDWEFFLHLKPREVGGVEAGPLDVEAYKHFLQTDAG
jgi:hypothetical protein